MVPPATAAACRGHAGRRNAFSDVNRGKNRSPHAGVYSQEHITCLQLPWERVSPTSSCTDVVRVVMSSGMRRCHSALSVFYALAVAGVSLLPPQHLHRAGIEGRTEPLVHAHPPDQSDAASHFSEAALSPGHGDHSLAVLLNGDFTASSSIAAHTSSPGAVATVVLPMSKQGPVLATTGAPFIHGPPRLVPVDRGPPSLS